jgi:hypothetical protein
MASSADGFNWAKQGVVYDPVQQGAQLGDHDALGASSRHVVCVCVLMQQIDLKCRSFSAGQTALNDDKPDTAW